MPYQSVQYAQVFFICKEMLRIGSIHQKSPLWWDIRSLRTFPHSTMIVSLSTILGDKIGSYLVKSGLHLKNLWHYVRNGNKKLILTVESFLQNV